MPTFPENMNGESICSGQPLSLVNSNLPRGEEWKDMGSEDRVYLRVLQNPFLHHDSPPSSSFFGRLEDPFDVSLHLIPNG